MNKDAFYASIRKSLFAGEISTKQFHGIEAILYEYTSECINDLRKLAYILSTAYHETAKTMQPIEEYGKGAGHDYGKHLDMGSGPGKRVPYSAPDKLYYGRGLVQTTWLSNYRALTKANKHGWDFVNHPELLMQMEPSIWATFYGMTKGIYTGKKLSDYFNDKVTDWKNARRIINGLDAVDKIAEIAQRFYTGLILT